MKCKTMIHLTGRNPIVLTDDNFSIKDIDYILSTISSNRSGLITLITDSNFIAFHSSQFVGIHFSSEDGTSFKQNYSVDNTDNLNLTENRVSESIVESDIDASEFVDSLDEFGDDEEEQKTTNTTIVNDENITKPNNDEDNDHIYDIDSVDEPESESDNIDVNEL